MSCQSCPANGGPCARCGGCIEPWQMKMAREMSERCGASQPAMEATDTCELPEGHAGYHVAHGARWSQGYTTPPAPPMARTLLAFNAEDGITAPPGLERGRCVVCGWSGGHAVGCHEPTHLDRPTTLDPLISVATLDAAFAAAEALYASRGHSSQGIAIRGLVYEAAPLLIEPLRAHINRLQSDLRSVTDAGVTLRRRLEETEAYNDELQRQHLAALQQARREERARIVAMLRETHIAANDFRGFNDAADFIEGSDL